MSSFFTANWQYWIFFCWSSNHCSQCIGSADRIKRFHPRIQISKEKTFFIFLYLVSSPTAIVHILNTPKVSSDMWCMSVRLSHLVYLYPTRSIKLRPQALQSYNYRNLHNLTRAGGWSGESANPPNPLLGGVEINVDWWCEVEAHIWLFGLVWIKVFLKLWSLSLTSPKWIPRQL